MTPEKFMADFPRATRYGDSGRSRPAVSDKPNQPPAPPSPGGCNICGQVLANPHALNVAKEEADQLIEYLDRIADPWLKGVETSARKIRLTLDLVIPEDDEPSE
jgi:hypothetical protein